MSTNAQELITLFDALPEAAKFEVAVEILRRTRDFEFPPLTDDELVASAEELFLELDQRELKDERTEAR
ncbi:MAG: hypothetical protein KF868_17980 [Acidobacteria bacterium]|nr:hypothetical protein [Acidobacteriota bacterium]MCW5969129.1 hypothetical protein [Blastocatellales bacterium]